MKKFFTLFTALLCAAGLWAGTATVNFAESGLYADKDVVGDVSFGECTVTFASSSSDPNTTPKYYDNGAAVRCYAGNTITVKSETEEPVTKVVFTYGTGDNTNPITVNVGEFDTDTWTGEADEVVFTIGGSSKHRRIAAITVTVGVPAEPIMLDNIVKFSACLDLDKAQWIFELDGGGWVGDEYLYPDLVIYVPAAQLNHKIAGTYAKDDIIDLYGDIDADYEFDFTNVIDHSDLVITAIGAGFYRFEITFTTDDNRTYIIKRAIELNYAFESSGSTASAIYLDDAIAEFEANMTGNWDSDPDDPFYKIVSEMENGFRVEIIYSDGVSERTGTFDEDDIYSIVFIQPSGEEYDADIIEESLQVSKNEDDTYTAVVVVLYETYLRFTFTIQLPALPSQGIDEVLDGKNASKYIRNGQLIIEKNNVRFNALGQTID